MRKHASVLLKSNFLLLKNKLPAVVFVLAVCLPLSLHLVSCKPVCKCPTFDNSNNRPARVKVRRPKPLAAIPSVERQYQKLLPPIPPPNFNKRSPLPDSSQSIERNDFVYNAGDSSKRQLTYKFGPDKFLNPMVGDIIVLNNVLFHFMSSSIVFPESDLELKDLLALMMIKPDMEIEIRGHINNPGMPDQTGQQISLSRAQSIKTYLTIHGINASRISCSGRNNYEMIYPRPKSVMEAEANVRVDFIVKKL
jgi:outer membrane protein OmpA-like peptidoglycan-associated protein